MWWWLLQPAAAQVVVASSGDVFATIGEALDAAAVGDTLTVEPGTYEEHVDVTFDVEIVGAADGVVITAEVGVGDDGVVDVDAGVILALRNLTLTSTTQRGISAPFGGTLDLTDVTFEGTLDVLYGGAIFLSDATLNCTRCAFVGTSSGGYGGAIYDDDASTLTITDSAFTNTSSAFFGGAIALESTTALTVVRSTFCAPSAEDGASIWGTTDVGVLTNNVFVEPAGNGGVLYVEGGTWTLTNNHFVGLEATIDAEDPGTTVALTNNLFVATGVHKVNGLATSTFDWNVFDGPAQLDFDAGMTLGQHDVENRDPLLVSYTLDGDCTNDTWWPSAASLLIDGGKDDLFDPDGTVSDVGAFGGPAADPALHTDSDLDDVRFLLDCDDADATAFPGADEICDGADDDCSGLIDDHPIDEGWWCDGDGDGQGASDVLPVNTCDAPPAADCDGTWLALSAAGAEVSLDCDDNNPEVFFGTFETCAYGDHNCDGDFDRDAVDASVFHPDDDGDGFGTEVVLLACTAPDKSSTVAGDCDDTLDVIAPGMADPCDGTDQDCDGADGDVASRIPWFPDADGDGFGSASAPPQMDCADLSGVGFVSTATDCNDDDAAVHPGAAEVCNLADDDCNTSVDDVGAPVTWFPDEDGDGFGDARFAVTDDCPPSSASVANGDDCDDTDPDTAALVEVWPDWDGDGFGACPDATCDGTLLCPSDLGSGWADNTTDCRDGDASVHPGATELAGNDIDEDCDGAFTPPRAASDVAAPGSGWACSSVPSSPVGAALALVLLLLATRARANEPPVVSPSEIEVTEDTAEAVPPPGLLAFATDDDEDDVLTAAVDDVPEVGTLLIHPDGSYVFTPALNQTEEVTFTWRATDSLGLASEPGTVTITITPVNDGPVAMRDGPLVTLEDEPLVVDPALLLANDLDVDDATLSVDLDQAFPPEHGTFVAAGGVFVYTPNADFAGTDVLTYWVVDGDNAESMGQVDVDVWPVGDAPLAEDDVLGEVVPGVPATGNVLLNDTDPEGDVLTAELVVAAAGAVVTLAPDGTFVADPVPGFVGSDAFTYVATDGTLSTPAQATWFVLPGTDPGPTDTDDPGTGCETTWFPDADGDGFGADAGAVDACDAPPGHVAAGGDCDDTVATVFPGAGELLADGTDQDCDGVDNTLRAVGACATGPPVGSFLSLCLLLLIAARPARAAPTCAEDTPAEVDGALVAVWDAYASLDEPGFDRASKGLALAVACLDRAPGPVQIARLHQGMALVSFVSGQTRAARKSLAAARLFDPGWKLPLQPFAEGHPYRELWEAATDPGPVAPIGRAPQTAWIVDGVERDDAPTQRAFLLQVASEGRVEWSGYLWSFDEIPDRGQGAARDALETPHDLWLSARFEARWLASTQTTTEMSVVSWSPEEAATGGLGGGLLARWTPVTVIGAEAGFSLMSPADAVLGGDIEPDAHAVLLLGGAGWTGVVQPHGAVRLGAAVGRTRAWAGPYNTPPEAWVSTVGSLDVGLETGVRSDRWRVAFTGDGLVAGLQRLSEIRLSADGGALLGRTPLALEGGLMWRTVMVEYEGLNGALMGTRTDRDLRLAVGIGYWR